MKVIISEACDSFTLIIDYGQGEKASRHYFNQEDDKTGLVEFFKELGIEAEYEEDY